MAAVRIAVHGAAGRMGRRLVALAAEDKRFELAGAIEAPGAPDMGRDVGDLAGCGPLGVRIDRAVPPGADVVIDFSLPPGTRALLPRCAEAGCAVVVGTTGLTPEDHELIDQTAQRAAVLQAPNMSLGVNLLFALAARAAATLGDDYDTEIIEAHHRCKQDAPSGTAMGLAEAICSATGRDLDRALCHGREGQSPRRPGEIGMHAVRAGDVVGEHTAMFAALGERLELRHVASDRDVFVRGALRAAAWLAGKAPGRYGMADVLGLER